MAVSLGIQKPCELDDSKLRQWMKKLLIKAKDVGAAGDVPVTAVILDSHGRSIGHGSNSRQRNKDPLGHAEIIALRQAALIKGDWRFNDCSLIVTLEPCTMCSGALLQARMGQVFYGAPDKKRGGLGGSINLADHPSAHHKMKVKGGIMEEDVRKELQYWFRQQRRLSREN